MEQNKHVIRSIHKGISEPLCYRLNVNLTNYLWGIMRGELTDRLYNSLWVQIGSPQTHQLNVLIYEKYKA
jgi:hypothetical protein